MRHLCLSLLLIASIHGLVAQGYTTWITGNPNSITTEPLGGVCLMGGATENDEAMKWFLQRANGGDVLVLRASGSNGYNNYFHSELGVTINRVETIRFDNATAAYVPYIHQRIQEAEAIWFAGGDQWNYVNYWRDTPVATLVNEAIQQRGIVIGGTSAGMAILGGAYFTAQVSSVTSAQALANPYHPGVTVSTQPFLEVPYMEHVVTDTHYDNPDRRGRHTVFMARTLADHGWDVKGIASEEYVAVCVDTDGIARVYGEYPAFQDFAFFLQVNCLEPDGPETITPGVPLTWHHGGQAVKAYRVPGTMQGTHTFDLNDWNTGNGGTWQSWSVQNGTFTAVAGDPAPNCITATVEPTAEDVRLLYDGSTESWVLRGLRPPFSTTVIDPLGRPVPAEVIPDEDGLRVRLHGTAHGLRILMVRSADGVRSWKLPTH